MAGLNDVASFSLGSNWIPLAGAGLGLGSAYLQSRAAQGAADTQANAANLATQVSNEQFNQTRQDLEPWRRVGGGAVTNLYDLVQGGLGRPMTLADFQADPGYQFRQQQGEQGINRAAAARGLWDSGATLKDLARFNSGLASQEYQNAWARNDAEARRTYNQLAGLAGTGQQAATSLGQLGAQNAQNVGNLMTSGAAAQAAGQVGSANAWGNALGSLGNMGMTYGMWNSRPSWSQPRQSNWWEEVPDQSAIDWGV